ncbi:MAG: MBL fold metallo-hydrolase [Saprospiraceae bacterium]
MPVRYISNPALPVILSEAQWKGTPIDNDGRFFHPDYPFELGWQDVLKWKLLNTNPYAEQKKKDTWRPTVVKDDRFLHHDEDVAVWLGHASFFFRLNGLSILIDPVFGKLSPLMPRHSELPVSPEKFNNIDLILLTHDHRDHCDKDSLSFLFKNNPAAEVVTGLGMGHVIRPWMNGHPLTEMGWFQLYELEKAGLKIYYLPTRHWCRRFLTDLNERLWGAFVLQTANTTIYFGGDSGYGQHYLQAASLFPSIDFAFLGIGAFAPEWFMQSNHMSPAAAFRAFQDLGAKKLVPMHYGTFDLSDEPLGEPLRLIKKIAEQENAHQQIQPLSIGETALPAVKNTYIR